MCSSQRTEGHIFARVWHIFRMTEWISWKVARAARRTSAKNVQCLMIHEFRRSHALSANRAYQYRALVIRVLCCSTSRCAPRSSAEDLYVSTSCTGNPAVLRRETNATCVHSTKPWVQPNDSDADLDMMSEHLRLRSIQHYPRRCIVESVLLLYGMVSAASTEEKHTSSDLHATCTRSPSKRLRSSTVPTFDTQLLT